jgi:hypothetical protein
MYQYDPLTAPDPETWLALDDHDQIEIIEQAHRRLGDKFPKLLLHSVIHNIAENQLAMGMPEVRAALKRVMAEGLDRHQAIHALGSVIMEHLRNMLADKRPFDHDSFNRSMAELTAAKWWAMADVDVEDVDVERPPVRATSKGGRRKSVVRRPKKRR